MKHYTFFREDNKFDDILTDAILKKHIIEKIKWFQYLMIGVKDQDEGVLSYLTLKYGDDIVTNYYKDFSPIPGVDYKPKKDSSKFSKSIS
jgi:hypothetical protein